MDPKKIKIDMFDGVDSSIVSHSNSIQDSLVMLKSQLLTNTAMMDTLQSQINFVKQANIESVFRTDNLWMMIATALVFIMHLGFATLESGLVRAKNTSNVLFKNTIIPAIGLLTYALVGFNLMYPGFVEGESGFFKCSGFGLNIPEIGEGMGYFASYTFWTDFLFQGMFAATCATIVSGAVAERIKLMSFIIFSILFVAFVYPLIGSWLWGGGWLKIRGFHDFAGSTLVHSVGGWGALAGVILLGARLGKYDNKKILPIPGHSLTSAVIGTFLLWLGWFGFNGGSVLSANPAEVSKVLVNTCLAASAGCLVAAITIFVIGKIFDLSMTLNGILAGLVGVTAGADQMSALDSVIVGSVAGILVVLAILFFEKLKLDDPVGALSVHLVCGVWGTMAVGILGKKAGLTQLVTQLVGIGACGLFAFSAAFLIFFILKKTIGLRVSKEEEIYGLDTVEHGMSAYSFVTK